jgi:hypothetical protein
MAEAVRTYHEWLRLHEELANTIRLHKDKVNISEYVLQEFLKDSEVTGLAQQFNAIDAAVSYSGASSGAEGLFD